MYSPLVIAMPPFLRSLSVSAKRRFCPSAGSGSVETSKPPSGASRERSISRIAALSRRSGRLPQALSGSPIAEFDPWVR